MKKLFFLCCFIISINSFAQEFTRADTLRGSITPQRAWWDVLHYDLKVEVNPEEKSLKGSNTITYKVLKGVDVMQIDLQAPMKIEKIIQDGQEIPFSSEGDAHFLELQKQQIPEQENQLTIFFSGKPIEARRPPWDGGFTWTTDSNGTDFIANSNQGNGASLWWPLKDHPYDEPDNGVTISVTCPKGLMDVSNGRLQDVTENGDYKTWVWNVVNPINTYGININIGDYVTWSETYKGKKGPLDLNYYVLRENEAIAKEQFKQVPMMMEAFEYWFGPYPFYEDGYKLVQAPYLGMEHQSSVTYGNEFKNGYLGKDLSGSGWGLKFDFIIIHESAHEWFANNITNKDVADMWIHEGFTCYAENLYLDYHFGKRASSEYVIGLRKNILNDSPMIGIYNMNSSGSSDIYYKGANILHTLRQWIDNDKKWRNILKGLNRTFYHQTVTTQQVEEYIANESGLDLKVFWDQYLRTVKVPVLEFQLENGRASYRYSNVLPGFKMPLIAMINGKEKWITPSGQWQEVKSSKAVDSFGVKKDFFVEVLEKKAPRQNIVE